MRRYCTTKSMPLYIPNVVICIVVFCFNSCIAIHSWARLDIYQKVKASLNSVVTGIPPCPTVYVDKTLILLASEYGKVASDVPFGPTLLAEMFGMGFYVNGTSSTETCEKSPLRQNLLTCTNDGYVVPQVAVNICACRLQHQSFPTERALSSLLSAVQQFAPGDPVVKPHLANPEWLLESVHDVLLTMFVNSSHSGPPGYGPAARFIGRLEGEDFIESAISTFIPSNRDAVAREVGSWQVLIKVPASPDAATSANKASANKWKARLDVKTLWVDLAPLGEPSFQERALQKGSRINEGSSIALSGMGTVSPFILDGLRHKLRYAGLRLQTAGSKEVYLVDENESLRLLNNWNCLLELHEAIRSAVNSTFHAHGLADEVPSLLLDRDAIDEVHKVTVPFFHSFVMGDEISTAESFDVVGMVKSLCGENEELSDARKNAVLFMKLSDQEHRLPNTKWHHPQVLDYFAHTRSANIPILGWDSDYIEVEYSTDFNKNNGKEGSASDSSAFLPLCKTQIKGRWMTEPECIHGANALPGHAVDVLAGVQRPFEYVNAFSYWLHSNISDTALSTWYRSNTNAEWMGSICMHNIAPYSRPNSLVAMVMRSGRIYQRIGRNHPLWGSDEPHATLLNEGAEEYENSQPSAYARANGVVFKAENCQMVQYLIHRHVIVPVTEEVATGKLSLEPPLKSHCDFMHVLASQPIDVTKPIPHQESVEINNRLRARIRSTAAFSLFSAGVGLWSGFGDSLGDEILDNLSGGETRDVERGLFDDTLPNACRVNYTAAVERAQTKNADYVEPYLDAANHRRRDWAVVADGDNGRGVGVRCVGNAVNKMHKLEAIRHDEVRNTYWSALGSCIEDTVGALFNDPSSGAFMESPVYRVHSGDGENVIENPHNHTYDTEEPIWVRQKIRKVVISTNFMAHHNSWQLAFKDIRKLLEMQAVYFHRIAQNFKEKYGIDFQRIFVSSNAVHGFVTAGLTPARQERFNELAVQILQPAGWEILDAYNLSLARPDMTIDGLHCRGGMSKAVTDVLMNMVTNDGCK